jgi:hypothetical protein
MHGIDEMNELPRASIRQHANFPAMIESLSEPTHIIVESLLAGDVTPELIPAARRSTPEEFRHYTFLRALQLPVN